jgi:hypothetical protein
LAAEIQPLKTELSDLEAAVSAEVAAEADLKRLVEVRAKLTPLVWERNQLCSQHKLALVAQDAREAARLRLRAIDATVMGPPAVNAAKPADAKLTDAEHRGLLAERDRLEAQLLGRYPWFVDSQARPAGTLSPSAASLSVANATVILETRAELGASTGNSTTASRIPWTASH